MYQSYTLNDRLMVSKPVFRRMQPQEDNSDFPNEDNGQIYRREHNILSVNSGFVSNDDANGVSNTEGEWKPPRRRQSDLQPGGWQHPGESPSRRTGTNRIPGSRDSSVPMPNITGNAELETLLRSQITELLEENERILKAMDEYREQEKTEIEHNPSSELVALQSELADARMREAELTVAFGELHHRIAAIDRIIESDPDMEQFFNAVSISTTTLSRRPADNGKSVNHRKPSPANRVSMPLRDRSLGSDVDRQSTDQPSPHDRRSPRRSTIASTSLINSQTRQAFLYNKRMATKCNPSTRSKVFSTNHNLEAKQHHNPSSEACRSGLESPQSDSGCSSTSQNTASDPLDNGLKNDHSKVGAISRRQTAEYENYPIETYAVDDESPRTRGLVSLLRRSRSSATDKSSFLNGLYNGEFSQSPPRDLEYYTDQTGYQVSRPSDDTPTPTEEYQTELVNGNPGDSVATLTSNHASTGDNKRPDRLSRLRASFRESFGFGPAKPDFRNEAFAARQGEARALLALRESRLELLRLQARCQTLQRHVERLESVNDCRVEELECNKVCERELRQEIRTLQRKIFNSEAEHREYVVNQRISEMELMSKLAEANLRLSHAELVSQQAEVWCELNRAHEAATSLLDSGRTPVAQGNVDRKAEATERPGQQPGRVISPKHQHVGQKPLPPSTGAKNPDSVDQVERTLQKDVCCTSNESTGSSSNTSTTGGAEEEASARPSTHYHFQRRDIDQSLGSMSDLRLQPDFPVMTRTYQGW